MCTLIHMLNQFDEVMKVAPEEFDLMNLYSFMDSMYGGDIKSKENDFMETCSKTDGQTNSEDTARKEEAQEKDPENVIGGLDFTNLFTLFNSLQQNGALNLSATSEAKDNSEINRESISSSERNEENPKTVQSAESVVVLQDETFPKHEWRVELDMKEFRPDDLSIKIIDGNMIHIEGKFEEEQQDGSYTMSHMVKKYSIPEGYDVEKTISRMQKNGVLSIVTPKTSATNSSNCNIPIERE